MRGPRPTGCWRLFALRSDWFSDMVEQNATVFLQGLFLLLAVLIKWLPCRQLQRAQARPKVTENRSIIFPHGTFLWNNYC